MKSFTDGAGRSWTLAITVDALKRVQGLLGLNLADVTEPQRGKSIPLLTELEIDLVLLCDVIYVLVKPQADEHGVGDEDFGRALGGEVIAQAHAAFWAELSDFFQRLPHHQAHVRAIAKQCELIGAAVAAAEQRIETMDTAAEVERAFGRRSTNLPGSPESSPAH